MTEHEILDPIDFVKCSDVQLWTVISTQSGQVIHGRTDIENIRLLLDSLQNTQLNLVPPASRGLVKERWRQFCLTLFPTLGPSEVPLQTPTGRVPAASLSSADAVENYLREQAYYLHEAQCKRGQTQLAIGSDPARYWSQAELYFVLDMLDGRWQFPWQLGSPCFRVLENVWMEEVKRTKAYLAWERQGGEWNTSRDSFYYLEACEEIRLKATEESTKLPVDCFRPVKDYLEAEFFRGGKVDLLRPAVKEQLTRKAYRTWEVTRRPNQDRENWDFACRYTQMFYENIVGAVMDHDMDKAAALLRYLAHGDTCWPRYQLISAFEASLVIFFVDTGAIQSATGSLIRVI